MKRTSTKGKALVPATDRGQANQLIELPVFSDADSEIAERFADFFDSDLTENDLLEDAPERWERSEPSDFFCEIYHECFPEALAQEIHNFVRLVAHPYRHCFDSPSKSPRNEEILSAIKNQGQKGSCTFIRETGKFILRPLTEWMSFGNNLLRKHYYTSDQRVALLYHDVDCHLDFQTKPDADAARRMIEAETAAIFGVSPLFLSSDRGENGFLKADLAGVNPRRANEIFDEYQSAIRLLFAKHQLMADFEIKGTVTWIDDHGTLHAGRYGKLPMCLPRWNYKWHRSLAKAKRVTITQIQEFIEYVKDTVTDEDIARHQESKYRAFLDHYLPVGEDQRWRLIARMGRLTFEDSLVSYKNEKWIARRHFDKVTITKLWPSHDSEQYCEKARVEEVVQPRSPQSKLPTTTSDSLDDLRNEPDALVRQRKALLKLARYLKRIPTVDEALQFIRDNGLYSGTWANPARRNRVRGILKFIGKTFDSQKCTKPNSTLETVNIGKYDQWARTKFPNGLRAGKKKILTADLQILDIAKSGKIEWEFVSVFISVCEFLMIQDKRPDGSVPHERAMKLWNSLHNRGLVQISFDNRKWAVCRDRLDKLEIIKITDRKYETNKAMRWAVGRFFPLLNHWKTKKVQSSAATISVIGVGGHRYVITVEGQHNSLLHMKSAKITFSSQLVEPRPPPSINSG